MIELLLEAPAYMVELASEAPFFQDRRLAETLISEIDSLRCRGDFFLFAFVLLPDAWMGIITPRCASVKTVLRRIREATSKRLRPALLCQKVWKQSLVKETIQEGVECLVSAGQLHLEPVRAGLVDDPEDYPFSSFRHFMADGPTAV